MQKMPLTPRFIMLCLGAALAAGCAASSTASSVQSSLGARSDYIFSGINARQDSLRIPALIAVNTTTGALETWPIRPGGGNNPQTISRPLGVGSAVGMVANGHVLAIPKGHPSGVVIYNVTTKSAHTLPDPFGSPGDIAIGKDGAIYVVNFTNPSNVAMYRAGSSQPKKLVCKLLNLGESIAVDNEGDIFVGGFGHGGFAGVVEIPNGPGGPEPENCTALHLTPGSTAVAGMAIDPKTDDLILLDNPDECAGGVEGRMTIYTKPYGRHSGRSHDLGANCSGGLRLNATSTIVFVGDQDVSGSFTFVLQRSYPDGRDLGVYNDGDPGAMTTIPNTLPN